MKAENRAARDEAEIRALIDDLAQAIRAKDVDWVMSHYAAGVVNFDLAPPLQYQSVDAIRESLQAWFPTFRGPVGYEVRDLGVAAGAGVAFCHSLNRISGARTDGEETDVWVRATLCLRKIEGRWAVTHEHTSVPFYMDGSYRAAVDLAP